MRTTHRNYSEEHGDFNRLAHFFIVTGGEPRAQSGWCMGRIVDWKWARYENKRAYAAFCDENAHLWFDGFGELAGFAISESGDAGFHVLTLDGYRFLYEEILQWVLENWKDRIPQKGPCFSTEITEHQGWEARILERYGFRPTDTFFTRRFDLTRELPARPPLKPGFLIVEMRRTKSHTLFNRYFLKICCISARLRRILSRLEQFQSGTDRCRRPGDLRRPSWSSCSSCCRG